MINRATRLLGLLLIAVTLRAQTGSFKGTIKDQADAPVNGASVLIVNTESGEKVEATTNPQGEFQVGMLAPGDYSVRIEYRGTAITYRFELLQRSQAIDIGTLTVNVPQEPTATPSSADPTAAPQDARNYEAVTVTARRVEEEAQDVPLPVSVVSGPTIQKAGAFNINRLKEMLPTVQFYSSNPRNSAINIRGLGSPFGLTNDGIDSGVGFYVDGVFYARPAAATLDFLDLDRVEVLRGPQGTLFGKNTTAGAINVTTRKPTFKPEQNFELSYGTYGFVQAKGSFSGPVYKDKIAARLSFSGTQRDGLIRNVATGNRVNDLNNLGVRAQVLILPKPNISILLSGDFTRQRPQGYAQVIAGVAPTLRPANRQWPQIASSLGYTPPSMNPFDRLTDTDTQWRSNQDMGGGSATLEWDRGSAGTLTSITAWRFWNWNPSNDRDFTALPITTISAAPSNQTQFSQEVRYAGKINSRTTYLVGVFAFHQNITGNQKQEQGAAAAAVLLAPSAAASTPGLLTGYGQNILFDYNNGSSAVFGELEYSITERLKITPGLRYNRDSKNLNYNQTVYGGLQTTDPALLALKNSILSPLAYQADVVNHNVSGQLTLSYKTSAHSMAYATYATGYKPIGLNLGGVPMDAAGNPVVSAATVRPEKVHNWELGLKTNPVRNVTANFSVFNTSIRDFQTQVVNGQVGVLRGYLANADKVRVRGVEFDGAWKVNSEFNVYASAAFTDGRYLSFKDAPPPLEETGGPQVKDISGAILPGISKWAYSVGGEYTKKSTFFNLPGEYFARLDMSYRSWFSSNASPSLYLNVDGYALFNPRIGFRGRDDWEVSLWSRNVANKNYFELLSPAPGNSGLYVGLPGDQRTIGITLRKTIGGN